MMQHQDLHRCAEKTASIILVVDDDASGLRLLCRILSNAGYRVVGAEDADAALNSAADENFDLLISDISMPGKDGWQLMRELSARHTLPGIAFSAHDSAADRLRSRDAGFLAHLGKPLDVDLLLSTVRQILQCGDASLPCESTDT